MKVLPKGIANLGGVLIGFPALGLPPNGLGHGLTDDSQYFEELDVHLPRHELSRRRDMRAELDALHGKRIVSTGRRGTLVMAT